MPRPNRVDAFGRLHAVPDRGMLMGNRGCLHDAEGRIVRTHSHYKAWISCVPSRPGVRRTLMAPGAYTELFFLDEATALAAGHRPCFECRRDRALAFVAAWAAGQGLAGTVRVPQVDAVLHDERTRQAPERFDGGALPDGAMIGSSSGDAAWLRWRGGFHRWHFSGYSSATGIPSGLIVLTPPSIVAALAAGFVPVTALD